MSRFKYSSLIKAVWKKRIVFPLYRRFHPEVEIRISGKKLRINLRDCVLGRLLFFQHGFENEIESLIRSLPLEGKVCVDVGANIGLHTITMSQGVGSNGQVFAYEPEDYNFHLLQQNLSLNKCRNVTIHHCAVGDEKGVLQLSVNPHNFGDHSLSMERSNGAADSKSIQDTPVTTLDGSLADVNAGDLRLIKIDVQGYEYHVVRGMQEIVEKNPDLILLIEIEPELLARAGSSPKELLTLLHQYGLQGWEINSFRAIPLADPWVYHLIKGRGYVNAVLSRNPEQLERLMRKLYERAASK